jgi:cephalosporin hydroxylase
MIKPKIENVKNLEQFYKELTSAQQQAHGIEYTSHHSVLQSLTKECDSIKELGVCQGATLAAMMFCNPNKITGIDIDPQYFLPYQNLFETYAKENQIDFEFICGSSHDKKLVTSVDLLHIDSYHTYDHLIKELSIHAPEVKKYIVFHDTVHGRGAQRLLAAIAHYITEVDPKWEIIEHSIKGSGHTVIKRIK